MRYQAWGILVGAVLVSACWLEPVPPCSSEPCEDTAPGHPGRPRPRGPVPPGQDTTPDEPSDPQGEPPPEPPDPMSAHPCVACATNGACSPEGLGRCPAGSPRSSGRPTWSRVLPGLPVEELALQRRDETAVVLGGTTLLGVKAGGQLNWERHHETLVKLWDLAVSPATDELHVQALHGPMCEESEGCFQGASYYRLRSDGDCPTWLGTTSDQCTYASLRIDARGRVQYVSACGPGSGSALNVGEATNAPAWSLSLDDPSLLPLQRLDSVFDRQGNILVAGSALRRFELQGRVLGHEGHGTPLLLAFNPRGELLWAEDLSPREGFFTSIAAASDGSVRAVLRTYDTSPWVQGGTGMGLGWHLVSLAPEGGRQWSRRLPGYESPPRLAVSADGRAAVAGPIAWGFGGQLLALYEADGGFRGWNQLSRATPSSALTLTGLDFQNGSPVLAGKLQGVMDVGAGTVSGPAAPGAWDGVLLGIPW